MANAFQNIAEQINFFGNQVLIQLRANLALVDKVNRDYRGAVSAAGATITIPTINLAGAAATRATDGAVTVNSGSSKLVTVTMQQVYYTFEVDNLQQTFSNINLLYELAQRASIKMADGIDSLLTALWPLIPYRTGKLDGTAVFNSTDKMNAFMAARKLLKDNRAPTDQLFAVLGTTEEFNLSALDLYQQAQQAGDSSQLRTGQMKKVVGIQPYSSQSIPTNVAFATAAQWAAPTVNGTPAIGSTSIVIAAAGLAQTLKAGHVFTIAGDLQPYSLTADAVTTGAGAATLLISPPLAAQPLNGAVITPVVYTATHSINIVADPSAYLLVVRPQNEFVPGAGVFSTQYTDPVSGLTFRMNIEANVAGNPNAGSAYHQRVTLDMLAGAQLIRPELAVRLEGQP
jgi:hypothetical protein